jgi:hypothetical protein
MRVSRVPPDKGSPKATGRMEGNRFSGWRASRSLMATGIMNQYAVARIDVLYFYSLTDFAVLKITGWFANNLRRNLYGGFATNPPLYLLANSNFHRCQQLT